MNFSLIILFIIFIVSIAVHEYAHGWMALRCGDNTARNMGRLTLNPIAHIDIVGTVLLPVALMMSGGLIFGWAKPVPVNPANFHNPGVDNAKVSAAGPVSNLLLAVLFTAGSILFYDSIVVYTFFKVGIQINLLLAIFNLIPLAPLDGSHIIEYYIPQNMKSQYFAFQKIGPMVLLVLVFSGWIFGTSLLFRIINPPFFFL